MQNGFEVGLPLTRVWKDDSGALRFEGVASSTSLDKQQERMTENAIRKMATFTGIDLLPSHRAGPLEELGTVTETQADNQAFRVAGVLDEDSPEARRLFEKVSQGKAYQLSVGGRVTQAFWAHDDELGKRIKHIDDVELDHVALCRPGQAANPDTYLQVMAKSIADDAVEPADELLEEEREAWALRLGRALLEALWRLAKRRQAADASEQIEEEQEEEPAVPVESPRPSCPPTGKSDDGAEEPEEAGGQAEGLRELQEQSLRLEKAVQALAERMEELEERRGQPRSIPGQEPGSKRRDNLWKGVL